MKRFDKSICVVAALCLSVGFVACEDACEYGDANTNNHSWVNGYTDSLEIAHPDSLAQSSWVRGEGIKFNAYGEEIQGYVESLEFISKNQVKVKMSKGKTDGTMGTDDSNTDKLPYYEYEYTSETGNLKILKEVEDDKGNVSKTAIFEGVAVSGTKYGDVLTVVHYDDIPAQTYLVRMQ